MSYDKPQYTARHVIGPIFATFAAAIYISDTYVKTSATKQDRIEFFRKVKITGFRATTRAGGKSGADLAGHLTRRVCLQYPTTVTTAATKVATCVIGTAAGLTTSGAVVAANAEVSANQQLRLTLWITGDGTASSMNAMSADCYIEYQDRN